MARRTSTVARDVAGVPAEAAEAVFVPGDPARFSKLALWSGAGEGAGRGTGTVRLSTLADHVTAITDATVDLVLPAGRSVRTTTVAAQLVPWPIALEWLVELAPTDEVPASLAAGAVVARLATDLVARGRVIPSVSAGGFDTWRLGLLDPLDDQRLDAIAAAMPGTAHALAWRAGTAGPRRIADASWLVRQAADAVADALVRTPAARHLVATPAYAAFATPVEHLRPWVTMLEHDLVGCRRPTGIRLEIPSVTPASTSMPCSTSHRPSPLHRCSTTRPPVRC
jgi:hypothetical protein